MDYSKEFANKSTISACLTLRDQLLNSEEIFDLINQVKEANSDEKKNIGAKLNIIKKEIQDASDGRIQIIQNEQSKDNYIQFDPTFYSSKYRSADGHKHPISIVVEEIVDIFSKIGFDVFEGSLVESQWYNFTSVNTPDYHPARDMQDTFFLKQKDTEGYNFVMRTQVTASAVKYAKSHPAPFKVIFPGIVFRNENVDATHDINFTQFDMWIVDKKN
ncbi:hypothetical protein HC766_01985 [Candidatus Gracilibacteria bacterium]|nr:hypothetical protein [Candidatus Gracilibacteria bacterium]